MKPQAYTLHPRAPCLLPLTSCGAPPVSTCQLAAYVYPHLLPTTKALGGI